MARSQSVQVYLRLVQSRHISVRTSLDRFVTALTSSDDEAKTSAAKDTRNAIGQLAGLIEKQDRPGWLSRLDGILRSYGQNHVSQAAGLDAFKQLADLRPQIEGETWLNVIEPELSIDFAAIYAEAYAESSLPDLFDALVEQLEQVVNSGELDSIKTIDALEKLIATVRSNSRADLFATRTAADFVRSFVRNCLVDALKDIPGLKHAINGLEATLDEFDMGWSDLSSVVSARVHDETAAALPDFAYTPKALPEVMMRDIEEADSGAS